MHTHSDPHIETYQKNEERKTKKKKENLPLRYIDFFEWDNEEPVAF